MSLIRPRWQLPPERRDVCRRDTEALTLITGAVEMLDGGFTLVALPDTQVYSLRFPGLFTAQTAWIAENAEALHIAHVIHLGDVVNNNTPLEWERAHTQRPNARQHDRFERSAAHSNEFGLR